MKNENLYYFRGKKKVPFEPHMDLLAVSVQADLSDEQDKELLKFSSELQLKPEKVATVISEENVRVFRLPPGISEQDRVKIEKRLSKHNLVSRVGPIIHLSDQSISFMTNEFVVRFKEPVSENELDKIAASVNLKVTRTLPYAKNTFVLRAKTFVSYDLLNNINELARKDLVEYAEPNLVTTAIDDFTPNDFLFADQPHHQIINTEDAWDITQGDSDIIIAVVDGGCDIDHPDFTNPDTFDWDKVYEPFDFASMDTEPIGRSHGTKSSGIATAVANNNQGVAGVAPGCRLMPIRRPAESDIEYADLYVWIAGFDPESDKEDFPDPINPGADIISNSFGYYQPSLAGVMRDALDYITDNGRDGKGCVVVYSVGNHNLDFTNRPVDGEARQWAMYDRTIAVASSTISPPDAAEIKVSTSNFGSALDVCAPGGGPPLGSEARTMSTDNVGSGNTAGSASATTHDYNDFGQTSCACPQVAGIAALMLSVNPALTWEEVKQIIRDTADQIDVDNTDPVGQWVDTDGDDIVDFSQWYGFGRVNAVSAVSQALDELPPFMPFTMQDIETIVAAQEVIYMRRLMATMKRFIDECPTPPRPNDEDVVTLLSLVKTEMNKLDTLKTLHAKYISRKLVDRELLKAVATICRENADLVENMYS